MIAGFMVIANGTIRSSLGISRINPTTHTTEIAKEMSISDKEGNNFKEIHSENQGKSTRKPKEIYQKTSGNPLANHWKSMRKPMEIYQKTLRNPLGNLTDSIRKPIRSSLENHKDIHGETKGNPENLKKSIGNPKKIHWET